MQVEVTARARLHFGFLDLSGEGARRFGGIGLAISHPRIVLRIEPAAALSVVGEQAARIGEQAARFHQATGLAPCARIRIMEAIPEHSGLSSGTQSALAVASGLARLHGLDDSPESLCAIMGRGRRSGVGFHAFLRGGFILEGGHAADRARASRSGPPPLLARYEFPEDWRILLMLPAPARTISGRDEEEAFRRLPPAAGESAPRLAGLVLMRLLPALVERCLPSFGSALAEIQEIVGACFAPVQGGPLHAAAAMPARRLKEAGAAGVGQSSWGPALYAFASDGREEDRLRAVAREADPQATLLSVRGFNCGASVESL